MSREWYGYHFPELIRIVPDNYTYARIVYLMKNRKEFTIAREEELEAITMDSGKTAAIFEAMKTTIGTSRCLLGTVGETALNSRDGHLTD